MRKESPVEQHSSESVFPLRAKVLTVSDGVMAGTRRDLSSAALTELLESRGFEVLERRAIPDGVEPVANALSAMAYRFHGLIVTTGGTGFGPRDKTPEGTQRVLDRRAPGLVQAMCASSPLGMLARPSAGTRGRALIVNVAGSPNGAIEMLAAVIGAVPHALDLMGGATSKHPSSLAEGPTGEPPEEGR
jgi:molybdenum cofactor synthesis domain-containing protein